MKRKILTYMIVSAFLVILVTGLSVAWLFYDDMQTDMRREAAVEAEYMKAAIDEIGISYLEQVISPTPPNSENRITLIDVDGTVLLDNFSDTEVMENHLGRPEVQMAIKEGIGTEVRLSKTLDEQTYYYAVLLENGMVLRLANTSSSVLASMFGTFGILVVIAGIILLLMIAVSARLVRSIVAPVNEVNLECPLDNVVYDELEPLLTRLDRQNQTIQQQMEELKVKQREFTALTENMSEGFLVVDKNSEVLSYNTSALKLLGMNRPIGAVQSIPSLSGNVRLKELVGHALDGNRSEEIVKLESR